VTTGAAAAKQRLLRFELGFSFKIISATCDRRYAMESAHRVSFIVHKGKQVLVVDLTNCTPDEVTAVTDEVVRIVTAQPEHSVLLMADFAGAQFSRDAVTRLKEVTTYDRPYVRRAAWVHTGTLPKVFYEAIKAFSQREFPTFETREQALDFLLED
jgi:hypothetical protein